MDHEHQPYPPFELACVLALFTMLKNREVRDNPKAFAKHFYVLLGALLGMTVGEPDDVPPLFGQDEPSTEDLEGLLGELKAVQEDGIPETFGAADGEQAIDPATLAILINLAVTLIQKLIERRKNKT